MRPVVPRFAATDFAWAIGIANRYTAVTRAPVAIGGAAPWRVLVAAPEPEVVAAAAFHLANLGLRVATALTGSEVLDALRYQRPDLVVLSTRLPTIDGLEMLRRLRLMPGMRDVVVVMLLAAPAASDEAPTAPETLRLQALALGADDCLVTPFGPRELVLRTTALLRRLTRVLPDVNAVLTAERITLDAGGQEVMVDGQAVELTPRECLLLRLASGQGLGGLGGS